MNLNMVAKAVVCLVFCAALSAIAFLAVQRIDSSKDYLGVKDLLMGTAAGVAESEAEERVIYWQPSEPPEYLWYFNGEKEFRYVPDKEEIDVAIEPKVEGEAGLVIVPIRAAPSSSHGGDLWATWPGKEGT